MRQWLIEMRRVKELTQKQVANLAGISRSYYSDIELGYKKPGGKTAKKIADTLGFDMNIFFEDQCLKTSQKKLHNEGVDPHA